MNSISRDSRDRSAAPSTILRLERRKRFSRKSRKHQTRLLGKMDCLLFFRVIFVFPSDYCRSFGRNTMSFGPVPVPHVIQTRITCTCVARARERIPPDVRPCKRRESTISFPRVFFPDFLLFVCPRYNK